MNCLLLAATAKEIAPFLNYYRLTDNKQDIDILVSGVGLMATTHSLTKQISIKKPDLIIQAGIAGSFDNKLFPGLAVVVKQDTIADLSVMENKQLNTMFDLGLLKPNQAPFRNGWLVNPHSQLIRQTGLKAVKAVSVNHITTSKQMAGAYQDKFQAQIETMEGAALHYVCLLEKIPFVQIRSISNHIGERDKKKWKLKESVDHLNNKLIEFFEASINQ